MAAESAKVDGIIHDPQYVGEEAASVQYEGMIYPIQEWRPPNWPPHFPPLRIIRYKGIQRLVIVPTDPLCLGAFYMLQQTQEGLKQLDAAAAAVAGPPAAGTANSSLVELIVTSQISFNQLHMKGVATQSLPLVFLAGLYLVLSALTSVVSALARGSLVIRTSQEGLLHQLLKELPEVPTKLSWLQTVSFEFKPCTKPITAEIDSASIANYIQTLRYELASQAEWSPSFIYASLQRSPTMRALLDQDQSQSEEGLFYPVPISAGPKPNAMAQIIALNAILQDIREHTGILFSTLEIEGEQAVIQHLAATNSDITPVNFVVSSYLVPLVSHLRRFVQDEDNKADFEDLFSGPTPVLRFVAHSNAPAVYEHLDVWTTYVSGSLAIHTTKQRIGRSCWLTGNDIYFQIVCNTTPLTAPLTRWATKFAQTIGVIHEALAIKSRYQAQSSLLEKKGLQDPLPQSAVGLLDELARCQRTYLIALGHRNCGKSTFINSLLGMNEDVLPASLHLPSKRVVIVSGSRPRTTVVKLWSMDDYGLSTSRPTAEWSFEGQFWVDMEMSCEAFKRFRSETRQPTDSEAPTWSKTVVELCIDCPLLNDGISIVDTPGYSTTDQHQNFFDDAISFVTSRLNNPAFLFLLSNPAFSSEEVATYRQLKATGFTNTLRPTQFFFVETRLAPIRQQKAYPWNKWTVADLEAEYTERYAPLRAAFPELPPSWSSANFCSINALAIFTDPSATLEYTFALDKIMKWTLSMHANRACDALLKMQDASWTLYHKLSPNASPAMNDSVAQLQASTILKQLKASVNSVCKTTDAFSELDAMFIAHVLASKPTNELQLAGMSRQNVAIILHTNFLKSTRTWLKEMSSYRCQSLLDPLTEALSLALAGVNNRVLTSELNREYHFHVNDAILRGGESSKKAQKLVNSLAPIEASSNNPKEKFDTSPQSFKSSSRSSTSSGASARGQAQPKSEKTPFELLLFVLSNTVGSTVFLACTGVADKLAKALTLEALLSNLPKGEREDWATPTWGELQSLTLLYLEHLKPFAVAHEAFIEMCGTIFDRIITKLDRPSGTDILRTIMGSSSRIAAPELSAALGAISCDAMCAISELGVITQDECLPQLPEALVTAGVPLALNLPQHPTCVRVIPDNLVDRVASLLSWDSGTPYLPTLMRDLRLYRQLRPDPNQEPTLLYDPDSLQSQSSQSQHRALRSMNLLSPRFDVNLQARLAQTPRLSTSEKFDIAVSICGALRTLHQCANIGHGAVHARNVLLQVSSGAAKVLESVVLDIGSLHSSEITTSKDVIDDDCFKLGQLLDLLFAIEKTSSDTPAREAGLRLVYFLAKACQNPQSGLRLSAHEVFLELLCYSYDQELELRASEVMVAVLNQTNDDDEPDDRNRRDYDSSRYVDKVFAGADLSETMMCLSCHLKPRFGRFVACGHAFCCFDCSPRDRRCPICLSEWLEDPEPLDNKKDRGYVFPAWTNRR